MGTPGGLAGLSSRLTVTRQNKRIPIGWVTTRLPAVDNFVVPVTRCCAPGTPSGVTASAAGWPPGSRHRIGGQPTHLLLRCRAVYDAGVRSGARVEAPNCPTRALGCPC